MKIVHKLYVFNVMVVVVVLFAFGLFSYQRDADQFEMDMQLDAHMLGHALSVAVSDVWQARGQEPALALIRDANAGQSIIFTRWVWLDQTAEVAHRPYLGIDLLFPLHRGENVVSIGRRHDNGSALLTYIPVKTPSGRLGALELAEPLTILNTYTRTDGRILIGITLVLILVSGVSLSMAGHRLIGKRLKQLESYAQKIGSGDLSDRLMLQGRDEITALGWVMNDMATQLQTAHEQSKQESDAHLKAIDQLRHSERLATVGRLSAGMAHELGTPLNVVSGRAKLIMAEGVEREEVIECAEIIQAQTERMTNIIRQLLDFARRKTPQKSKVDLKDIIRQVIRILEPIAKKQNVALIFEADDTAYKVMVDTSQIQQVLMNIMMNGIHAMPQGGPLTLRLQSRQTQEEGQPVPYHMLSIKDAGPGISGEHMDHIFEPFFTTKEVGEGTGLGLSIAYGIILEHNGWIDVESEPGQGACFIIYFPGAH